MASNTVEQEAQRTFLPRKLSGTFSVTPQEGQLTVTGIRPSADQGRQRPGAERFHETGSLPQINVYLGTYPAFADCPTKNTWLSTGNFATDTAGLRWDTSQICPATFYNTYSGAVVCSNAGGYKINAILVGTDGGWSGTNQGPLGTGQTFLFENIEVNELTRFPR